MNSTTMSQEKTETSAYFEDFGSWFFQTPVGLQRAIKLRDACSTTIPEERDGVVVELRLGNNGEVSLKRKPEKKTGRVEKNRKKTVGKGMGKAVEMAVEMAIKKAIKKAVKEAFKEAVEPVNGQTAAAGKEEEVD